MLLDHQPANPHAAALRPRRRFLFDIVANKRNSIDVDKFDYLARDAKCAGVMVGCDTGRLMEYSQVRRLGLGLRAAAWAAGAGPGAGAAGAGAGAARGGVGGYARWLGPSHAGRPPARPPTLP